MVDRTLRPIVPTEHPDEREHRRLLAVRSSASFPKDGTEGMQAPLKLNQRTAAELVGDYAASLWTGSQVYVSDEGKFATSDGATWVRPPSYPLSLANGGTGAVLVDPNADSLVYWNDGGGTIAFAAFPLSVARGGTGQTTEAEAVGELIQALTEDTAPDIAADFLATYDASGDTGAKVSLRRVAPTVGSVAATTSGTAFSFTSIPAYVKRITIIFDGVSLSGTNDLLVQIGDSGGDETSGYVAQSLRSTTAATTSTTSTAGFIIIAGAAAIVVSGTLVLHNITGNTWIASGAFANTGSVSFATAAGSKTLSATLDRLTITRSGADTFDAGQVNIMYE